MAEIANAYVRLLFNDTVDALNKATTPAMQQLVLISMRNELQNRELMSKKYGNDEATRQQDMAAFKEKLSQSFPDLPENRLNTLFSQIENKLAEKVIYSSFKDAPVTNEYATVPDYLKTYSKMPKVDSVPNEYANAPSQSQYGRMPVEKKQEKVVYSSFNKLPDEKNEQQQKRSLARQFKDKVKQLFNIKDKPVTQKQVERAHNEVNSGRDKYKYVEPDDLKTPKPKR